MALPSSGALSFQDIATELGVNPPLSLASMSTTAGFTAPYAVTNFYGYSAGGIVTSGLILNVDASNPASYSGTGTDWYDLSGNNNTATLVNSPTFSTADGGYFSFNGSNQYASVPFNTNPPSTEFTEMAWVYINSASVGGGLTSDIFMGGGSIPFQYFNSYGNNAAAVGKWVFVVGTQSTAPLQQLYVDTSTANIVSAATSQTFGWTGLPWYIGKRFDSVYANARIGQAMVYNRALSAAEVLQNYNATKTRFEPSIVTSGLILNLDAGNPSSYSGSGTTWTDLSGNGYNSELINSPTFVSNGNKSYFNFTGSNYMQGNNSMSGNESNQISGTVGLTVTMAVTINNASVRSILFGHYQPFAPSGYVFEAGTLGGLWTNTLRTYMAGSSGQGVDARGNANTISTGGSYILQWVFDYPTKTTTLYVNDTAIGYVQNGFPAGLATDWNNNVLYTIGYDGDGNYSQIKVYGAYVYNTPLNSTQITQNYNALLPKIT